MLTVGGHTVLLGIVLACCCSAAVAGTSEVTEPAAFLTAGDAVQVLEFLAGKTVAEL